VERDVREAVERDVREAAGLAARSAMSPWAGGPDGAAPTGRLGWLYLGVWRSVAGFQAESGNLVNPVADFDLEETEAALQYDVRAVIGGRQRRLVAVSSHQDVSSQE
jgi:hypothetical protein